MDNPEMPKSNIIQRFNDLNITSCIPENDLKSLLKEVYHLHNANQQAILSQISLVVRNHLEAIDNPDEAQIQNVVTFFRAFAEDVVLNKLIKALCPASTLLTFASVLFPHVTRIIHSSKAESHASDQRISSLLHKTVKLTVALVKAVCKLKLKSKHPTLLEPLSHFQEMPHENETSSHGEMKDDAQRNNNERVEAEEDEAEREKENLVALAKFGLLFVTLLNNHPTTTLDIKFNGGLIMCYLVSQDFLHDLLCDKSSDSSSNSHSKSPPNFTPFECAVRKYVQSDYLNKLSICYGALQTCGDLTPEFMAGIATANLEESENSTKTAINFGAARNLEIWMAKVSSLTPNIEDLVHLSSVFRLVEVFVFTYLAGHIDAVKSCCRNILGELSNVYYRLDTEAGNNGVTKDSMLNELLLKIISKPFHIKWTALSAVSRANPHSVAILDLWKEPAEKLLCADRTFKNAAADAYLCLMRYTFDSMDTSTWIKTWISPLFRAQSSQDKISNWQQKKFILGKAMVAQHADTRIQQCILKEVIAAVGNSNTKSSNSDSALLLSTESSCLVVECLKIGTELGEKINPFRNGSEENAEDDDYFRGVLPRPIINSWASHANQQIRLAAFSLLVDSKKTSELFSDGDFETIKMLIKYNLVDQNPAFRQQFMSYFKKLMRRLIDGRSYGARMKRENLVESYNSFITWMWNFFIQNGLFAGANFSRRCQSLNCLAVLLENFKIEQFQEENDDEALRFLRWLDDTYENNKIAAVQILSKMKIQLFNDKEFLDSLYSKAFSLLVSVRPPDSVTARYILLLILKKSAMTPFALVENIVTKLEETLVLAKKSSLLELTATSPPYGMIRAIRLIFSIYQKELLEEASANYRKGKEVNSPTGTGVTFASLQILSQRLLSLCLAFDELLLPVLGSAAPEGFLPDLNDETRLDGPPENANIVRSINAQILLVGSWRTMKEICILLTDMCGGFPFEGEQIQTIQTQQQQQQNGIIVVEDTKSNKDNTTINNKGTDYVLSYEQVRSIGDHLVHLLMNLMHRGVFEQVFVGFKSLASRLHRSKNERLNSLSECWLNEIMNDKDRVGDKCVTRRSAGLPYIFQALLTPQVENEELINYWMEKLIEYHPVVVVRIHTMNILRGLYRDANFAKALMQWVPQGIELAFRGLRASEWRERNSGLMLFGSVIRRTFGPRLNLMSAPTFFRKFPQMYDFLLGQIKATADISGFGYKSNNNSVAGTPSGDNSSEGQNDNDFAYYLLLLFSCFSSAPGKLEEGLFKLSEFVPYIQSCGANPDIQVRTMAAKAIVPFITSPEERSRILESSLDNLLFHSQRIRNNLIHGDLLQLIALVKLLQLYDEQIPAGLVEKFQLIIDIVKNTKCPAVFEAFADLSIALVDSSIIAADSSNASSTSSSSSSVYSVAFTMQKVTASAFSTIYPASFSKRRNSVAGLPHADLAICRSSVRFQAFEEEETSKRIISTWIKDGAPCIIEELLAILILKKEQKRKKAEMGQKGSEYQYVSTSERETEENERMNEEQISLLNKKQPSSSSFANYINIDENVNVAPLLVKRYLQEEFHFSAQTDFELNYLVFFSYFPLEGLIDEQGQDNNIEVIVKLLDKLVGICQGEFASVPCRAAAVTLLAKLAFSDKLLSLGDKYKSIIADLFLDMTDTSYDDEIRMAVGQSIPNLPINSKHFSAEDFSKIWIALFKLALDDEVFIRDEAFKKLRGGREAPGCHLKCLEMLVEAFLDQIKQDNAIEAIWSLAALLMTEDFDVMMCGADDEDEDRLFDRSEMNLFRETVTLMNLVFNHLQANPEILNTLKTRFATTTLAQNSKGYQLYTSIINSRTVTTGANSTKNEQQPQSLELTNLEQLKVVLTSPCNNSLEENGNNDDINLNFSSLKSDKEQESLSSKFKNDSKFLDDLLCPHDNDKGIVNNYIRGKLQSLFFT